MKIAAALFITVFLFSVVVYAGTPVTEIVLYDDAGGERYVFRPKDGRFMVRFLHSWARSPVDELFVLSDDVLVLTGTAYEDFGAGLPHEPEAGGQPMRIEGGKIRLDGIDRPVPNLQIRVGRFVANHELFYDDVQLPLSRLFTPGETAVFGVRKTRRYALWFGI
ncbi:MAG: DUF1850 domain-containing protein [Synergistaceae bacterium]|jgi:hypothetical protein|nr:DUF1850 domain-containing protein [Synergistaceae bacterium]